jgi:murein DD-endopeptidase MepM/ murein hydrolase activator NlpD
MPKLAEMYVALRADDGPANKVIAGVRSSLQKLDSTRVQPNITMSEKPVADIAALEKRLAGLASTRVRLNVDSTVAASEVRTLGRQLEALQTSRHSIPVELQGQINGQIAEVERALAVATKRQNQIPLRLERITDQVAAVQTQLEGLGGVEVDVPVKESGLERVKQHLAAMARDRYDATIYVNAKNSDGGGDFDPGALLKTPALLAAVNVAASAMASLGAGGISLAAAMAPAAGAMAAVRVGMVAVQQGAAVANIAMMGVSDTMNAMAEMEAKVASGAKISKQEQAEYNAMLKAAGPAVVTFAGQLKTLQDGFDGLRKPIQNVLLPAFGAALQTISTTYLPLLRTQLVGTATVLAGVTAAFTEWLSFPSTVGKVNTVLGANNRILSLLGPVALNLADILLNIWVAALPMTIRFAEWLGIVTTKLAQMVESAAGSGALVAYFKLAGDTAAQLGAIFGNLAVGLFRVFQGGAAQGRTFLDLFQTLTARFAAWTGSLAGKNAIADFFARAQPVLNEVGLLVRDIAKAFGELSTQTGLAPVIAQVRTQLLPALLSIVTATSSQLLPSLVALATKAADFFNVMSGHGGSLVLTIDLLTKFANSALWLLNNIPGATTALGAFFAVMAVKQAFSIIGQLSGLTSTIPILVSAFGVLRGTVVATQAPLAAQALAWVALKVQMLAQAAASGIATAATTIFAGAARAAGVAMRFMLGPVGLIITGIGLLVAGVIYAYKNFEPFRNIVDTVGRALLTGLVAAVDAVVAAFRRVAVSATADWAAVKAAVTAAWNGIVSFFSTAGATIVAAVSRVWTAVATDVSNAWTAIRTAVSNAWNGIVAFFTTGAGGQIVAAIGTIWTTVRNAVAGAFAAIWGAIKVAIGAWVTLIKIELAIIGAVFLLAWQGLSAVARTAFGAVQAVIATVWGAIRSAFTTAQSALSAAWSAFWNTIKSVVSAAWNFVYSGIIAPVITTIRNAFNAFIAYEVQVWTNFWNNIKAVASAAWTFVRDNIITPIWNGIRAVFTAAHTFVRNAWNTFWEAIKTAARVAWTFVKDNIINPIWNQVKAIFAAAHTLLRNAWTVFWNAVRTTASTIFNAIRTLVNTVWNQIKTLWSAAQGVVTRAWDTFWGTIKRVGAAAIEWVRAQINEKLNAVKGIVSRFVSAVGGIWGGIQGKFSGPWNWVKNNVLDKLAAAYNAVAKVVGAPTLNLADGGPVGNAGGSPTEGAVGRADGGPIDKRAAGGRIRGRGGPRQDNIAGIDRATGVQTSWVSAGEYVVNAKQYQKNKQVVESINSGLDFNEAVGRRLNREYVARAFGGEIPRLWIGGGTKPAAGSVSQHSGYGWARWAGDINEPGAADMGKPVSAWKSGIVAATTTMSGSYGKHIRINHPGNERTLYAHLSQFSVSPGARVRQGQKIGEKGNTGNSSGPHLHFELAGGSDSITGKIGNAVKGAVESVIEMIKPRAMFTAASNPILGLVEKGLGALPGGDTPFSKMMARFPRKLRDMLASKLPESFGIESSGGGTDGVNVGAGSGDRMKNASVIAQVGKGGGKRAQTIGLITALVESGLRNVNYGDRDSLGLFQQRAPWGPASARMNPRTSAGMFYNGGRGGQRGLYDISGWRSMSMGAAAQRVQVSAFPGRYQTRVKEAESILSALKMADGGIVQGGRGGTLAHIGEGARDELVTPLPRGWKAADSGGDMRRLIALLEERGLGETHLTMNAYNPVAEPTTVSTNKQLQRVGALGIV